MTHCECKKFLQGEEIPPRYSLTRRSGTRLLLVEHSGAIADALDTAEKVNRFLGGGLDVAKMAAMIDAALYRNRAAT